MLFAAVGGLLVILICAALLRFFSAHPYKSLRAFRAASGSMCPTVCENDRVLVATDGYSKAEPKRGDVIAFHFHSTGQIFIKRIIGTGGDSISLAPNGTILVNGAAPEWPGGCGKPQGNRTGVASVRFAASAVPADSYFVIGDNLENSLDSRFQEFGFVTREQIVGKAVAVYWSTDSSHIGCSLE